MTPIAFEEKYEIDIMEFHIVLMGKLSDLQEATMTRLNENQVCDEINKIKEFISDHKRAIKPLLII